MRILQRVKESVSVQPRRPQVDTRSCQIALTSGIFTPRRNVRVITAARPTRTRQLRSLTTRMHTYKFTDSFTLARAHTPTHTPPSTTTHTYKHTTQVLIVAEEAIEHAASQVGGGSTAQRSRGQRKILFTVLLLDGFVFLLCCETDGAFQ